MEIGELCRDREVLLVADAITALGVYRIVPSQWGIDVLVGGSQKALLLPPGLSVLWFSQRAERRLKDRAFYFSIKKELKKQVEGQTAWTPRHKPDLSLKGKPQHALRRGYGKGRKQAQANLKGYALGLWRYLD
jgi:aspartate aminotransferase-like enzyme